MNFTLFLMRRVRRWQRTLILFLLISTVLAPLFLVSNRLKAITSNGREEFVEDLLTLQKYSTDSVSLKSVEQESNEGLKGPKLVVYEDKDLGSINSTDLNSDSNQSGNFESTVDAMEMNVSGTNHEREQESQQIQGVTYSSSIIEKELLNYTGSQNQTVISQPRRVTDEKVKHIMDQLVRAKAYLHLSTPKSASHESHLVKELRVRIKELDKAVGEATKDSELSRSALQKMQSMDASLSKASRIYPDCAGMATKLRAMAYNTEEQVRTQRDKVTYLTQLAGRTTSKGLHCLSMRLTAEYLVLQPEDRQTHNQQKLYDPNSYHYAVFSDNILACAAVVTSTISSAKEPEKIVFHVVSDALNYRAISMWFLLNPPGEATIQVQSLDNFEGLPTKFTSLIQSHKSHDPRYTSALNHLRFYLPDIFPLLDKILFLDHDVVVQRDLSELWSINMNGKVNAAVETCHEGEPSFKTMDMLINFSDPILAKRFDAKSCTWAFGMNMFDLHEWRRQNLTAVYHKYLQQGSKRPLWKAGSLPLGWITFNKQTIALDKRWHAVGLGYESGIEHREIEEAAVIHYDGVMKPWLDIGIKKYKSYWSKYVNYDHSYLEQCNIHE